MDKSKYYREKKKYTSHNKRYAWILVHNKIWWFLQILIVKLFDVFLYHNSIWIRFRFFFSFSFSFPLFSNVHRRIFFSFLFLWLFFSTFRFAIGTFFFAFIFIHRRCSIRFRISLETFFQTLAFSKKKTSKNYGNLKYRGWCMKG